MPFLPALPLADMSESQTFALSIPLVTTALALMSMHHCTSTSQIQRSGHFRMHGCMQELRVPTMVLRAFNAELAQIPDSVKQESLVQIRMQWWRDAVKSAYSGRPEPNPIILALREVPHCLHVSM